MQNSRQLAKTWPYPRRKAYLNILKAAAERWFKTCGAKTLRRMPYCLDNHDNWHMNIILPEVVDFIQAGQSHRKETDAFPLHKYLHHGLSSQAMLFNLVGPMFTRNDFSPLSRALRDVNAPWPEAWTEARLEEEDRSVFNEDSGQPTSIDLAIYGNDKAEPLFIEAKLVETGFGGCSVFGEGDCEGMNPVQDLSACYLHHIGRLYWKRMEEFGFVSSPLADLRICPFASYYQFFREAMFAVYKRGHFILLCDDRNPVFVRDGQGKEPKRGLWPFLRDLVPNQVKSHLHIVTIQQIVKEIDLSSAHADWLSRFKQKYALC